MRITGIISTISKVVKNITFNQILINSSGSTYKYLFNLRAKLKGLQIRVADKKGVYRFSEANFPEITRESSAERQASMSYGNGFINRANTLADSYMLNSIEFFDNDLIFDCGANVGDFKLWFDFNNINVSYTAFEPSPVEYKHLKNNLNKAQIFNIALWNKESEIEFFVSSSYGDSSLIEPIDYTHKIKIPCKRLDSFITQRVKLLKLEAEGAEPEILEGIGDKLGLIEYISADLGFERGLSQESTLAPVTNYLLKRDFELVKIAKGRLCVLFRNQSYYKN